MEEPSRSRSAAELWASFPHDPRDPAVAPLRASDADRDIVSQVLVEAFADGRLNREEYDERAAAVLSTRTLGELPPLVTDLVPVGPLVRTASSGAVPLVRASPADLQKLADEHWRDEVRNAFLGLLGTGAVLWVIWAVVEWGDWGFPWPAFITAFALLNVFRTLARRKEIVRNELRRLEKKQAKAIEAQNKPPKR